MKTEASAPTGPAVAFVFEGGGQAQSEIESDLRRIRHAVALDTLQVLLGLRRTGELDRVVLITDRPELARAAPDGTEVEDSTAPSFHYGEALAAHIRRTRAHLALVLGGAAAPLYGPEEFRRFLYLARETPRSVVQNNPQSPDVLAFSPAVAAAAAALPDSDNALGYVLSNQGLRRLLIENSARVNFDIDTPSDAALLAGEPGAGARTRAVLEGPDWIAPVRRRLEAIEAVLAGEASELALIGRVGPPVTGYLNMHLRCRLRVFSEERGMRALGRVASGSVVSFMGRLLDAAGPEPFFHLLSGCADAALFDTRVLLAHWRHAFSDADRFYSDIGRAEAIGEPRLAAFTAAAREAAVPIVLGGHTLVYGGLWLLADRVLRRLQPHAT